MDYRERLLSLVSSLKNQLSYGELILKGLEDADKNGVLTPDLWKEYILSISRQHQANKEGLTALEEEIKDAKQFSYLERKMIELETKLEQTLWKLEIK